MNGDVWFAVLPDGAAGIAGARLLRASATAAVEHGSGRPWLLGTWPDGHMTVAAVGAARLAVIGRCQVTADGLAARLARVADITDVEQAVRGLAGSHHVVASVGGRVWVRGSASGTRLVFRTRVGGAEVAADRSDVLARLTGAGLDEEALALHLLSSPPPYPLDTRCVWRGVEGVRPEHGLLLEPDGRARTRPWWSPPEPVRPRARGAPDIRQRADRGRRVLYGRGRDGQRGSLRWPGLHQPVLPRGPRARPPGHPALDGPRSGERRHLLGHAGGRRTPGRGMRAAAALSAAPPVRHVRRGRSCPR